MEYSNGIILNIMIKRTLMMFILNLLYLFKFNMNFHVLILLSFAIISVKPITFYFNLAHTENKCFGEFFTEGSNGIFLFYKAIFKINSSLKDTRVSIFSPNGNILYNKVNKY